MDFSILVKTDSSNHDVDNDVVSIDSPMKSMDDDDNDDDNDDDDNVIGTELLLYLCALSTFSIFVLLSELA